MNNETRKAYISNTERVYRENAAALRGLIPTIKQFDGKVFNKRLETALNEAAGITHHATAEVKYNTLRIEVYNHERSYKETPDTPGGYACTGYVDNETGGAWIDTAEAFTTADGGKWRINAAAIVEKIEMNAAALDKRADDIANANFEKMAEDFAAIALALRKFNDNYPGELRNLYGISYRLDYVGDTKTKNYDL